MVTGTPVPENRNVESYFLSISDHTAREDSLRSSSEPRLAPFDEAPSLRHDRSDPNPTCAARSSSGVTRSPSEVVLRHQYPVEVTSSGPDDDPSLEVPMALRS